MGDEADKKTLAPSSRPWPDLPQPLTEHILERFPLSDYIRFAAVCSRWRSVQSDHRLRHLPLTPPSLPLPLITIFDFESPPQPQPPCVPCFSPFEQKFYRLHPIPVSRSHCLASQSSWLLIHELTDVSPSLAFFSLFNPLSGYRIQLPPLSITFYDEDDHPYITVTGAISSPPSNPNCTVIIAHYQDFYLFCLGGSAWTKLSGPSTTGSVITVEGRFYCNCSGTLVRISFESPEPILEMFELDDTAIPEGGDFGGDLVEWNGEVLLVPAMPQEPETIIEGLQMFKADLVNNAWVKVESLGDYVVIVGHNSSSFSLLGDEVGVGRGITCFSRICLWEFIGVRYGRRVVLDLKAGKMGSGRFLKISKSDQIVFQRNLLRWIVPSEA